LAARKPFLLRIDAELWAEIEGWAAAELRSANGQVEYLLREAVRRRRGGAAPVTPPDAVTPESVDEEDAQ
jgi:hypothetical protein